MDKWIPVKEKLPEKKGSYLVFCQYRNGDTRQDIKLWVPSLQRFTSEANAVTHWRELPPDPDQEQS